MGKKRETARTQARDRNRIMRQLVALVLNGKLEQLRSAWPRGQALSGFDVNARLEQDHSVLAADALGQTVFPVKGCTLLSSCMHSAVPLQTLQPIIVFLLEHGADFTLADNVKTSAAQQNPFICFLLLMHADSPIMQEIVDVWLRSSRPARITCMHAFGRYLLPEWFYQRLDASPDLLSQALSQSEDGSTALYAAVRAVNFPAVHLILKRWPEVVAVRDEYDVHIVISALRTKSVAMVQLLLSHDPSFTLNSRDRQVLSVIRAKDPKFIAAVNLIEAAGLDVRLQDVSESVAALVVEGDVSVVSRLLETVDPLQRAALLNKTNALDLVCAHSQNVELLQLLIDYGADVNFPLEVVGARLKGKTPLFSALRNVDLVRCLHKNGGCL